MEGKLISAFLALMITIIICGSILQFSRENKCPETKPCECLSLETTLLYVAKTERFVDELQRAKKGQRNALIDSINYYRTLLKSSGNAIEY